MQVKIHAFIIAEHSGEFEPETQRYEERTRFKAWPCDVSGEDKVLVCEHDFEIEVPSDFDIRPSLVANLEEEKRKAAAEYQKRVTEINAQIQSLLAIEV